MSSPVASAYSATGAAWEAGPGRIYNRLAEVVVGLAPVPLAGRIVLDLGAGTGAASRALAAVGARAVAADAAYGMLAVDREVRAPAVLADAAALPFATGRLGGVVAAFSLNHVPDPVGALGECARVSEPGAPLVVSVYAADDTHPVKQAVVDELVDHGFEPEPWALDMYRDVAPRLADPDRLGAAGTDAGLDVTVHEVRVPFPELTATDLVAWRFGMAQHAPFLAGLPADERRAIAARALDRLGAAPALVRSILVLTALA